MLLWLSICVVVVGWILFKLAKRPARQREEERNIAEQANAALSPLSFTVETRRSREPKGTGRSSTEADWPDDDNDYADFVRQKWLLPGPEIGLALTRQRADGSKSFWLKSIVGAENGTIYLNGIEDGRKISLAGDGRHRWEYLTHPVDASAFTAILAGVPPVTALLPEPYPATVADAISPEKNRARPEGRAFIIGYENAAGHRSYRVISGVRRDLQGFSANCHFRWGSRRDFRFDRLREVFDFETGEEFSIDQFRRNKRSKPRPKPRNH